MDMDKMDAGGTGSQDKQPQGQGGNWLSRLAQAYRQLPSRSRRGILVAAIAAVMLLGYAAIVSRPDSPGRSTPPAGQTTPGDSPEAVIIVEKNEEPGAETVGASTNPAGPEAELPEPGTMLWPVVGELHAGYGWGYNQTLEDWRFHSGIDIVPGDSDQVLAAADGRVENVYLDPAWGWVAEVQHGPDFFTRYAGLSKVLVSVGDEVQRGDLLGTLGESTGVEAGLPPHLHLEIVWNGEPVDPATYLTSGS